MTFRDAKMWVAQPFPLWTAVLAPLGGGAMMTMVVGFVSLFVLLAVGPALARGLYRLVQRVPILGALAALALLVWVEGPASAQSTASERPALADLRVETTAWSERDPRAATTTDEDMPAVYLEERARYAREVESAKSRVQDWLGL